MEDRSIVALYFERDESAITHTADKYGRRLRSLALGVTEDIRTAEECENDTYLRAWDAIPPHDPSEYLYAFLARITRNLALSRCRENARHKRAASITALSAELEQCIPAPNDTQCRLDERLLGEAINGFLSTLNEEKRRVFVRRYWYTDSVAAIAARYALSQSKVKSMLLRCRNELRQYLIEEGFDL